MNQCYLIDTMLIYVDRKGHAMSGMRWVSPCLDAQTSTSECLAGRKCGTGCEGRALLVESLRQHTLTYKKCGSLSVVSHLADIVGW